MNLLFAVKKNDLANGFETILRNSDEVIQDLRRIRDRLSDFRASFTEVMPKGNDEKENEIEGESFLARCSRLHAIQRAIIISIFLELEAIENS